MRIETTIRSSAVQSRSGVGRSASGGFFVPDQATSSQTASAQPVAHAAGLDSLLALQAVDDPLLKKKKAIRRGNSLLDSLEAVKADMLLGRVSEGRLNQLLALVTTARDRQMPELDAVLDDIELRARVELAKFGRFPNP
ncbi:MAG: flagellar assembly regulator FliX [Hyphomicrobiales bacterium]|nr:MAG: flagellar assembly regulator FliX [Hyphomicrobiales bacterium]